MVENVRTLPLWWLALAAALAPMVTIHLTFVVSALQDHVPWCIPYWDSCTSISRTGRYGTAYFIFKGTMLPGALLGILMWSLNRVWLESLGGNGHGRLWLPWLGLVAGVSLGGYTLALGHEGEGFNLIRRIGVVLYFSLSYIAELLISGQLRAIPGWRRTGQRLLWLCELTLAVGIVSVILHGTVYEFYRTVDDAFEWVLALLINLHALWLALLWRRSRFRATPSTNQADRRD